MANEEWREILRTLPLALEPVYSTATPNETVELYSGELSLRQGDREITGSGKVLFKWTPTPRATFEVEHPVGLVTFDDSTLWLPDLNLLLPVSLTHVSYFSGTSSGRVCDTSPLPNLPADLLLFHVPNFHPYRGDPVRNREGDSWRGRLELTVEKWRIKIDAVLGADDLRKILKSDGGFAITNTGSIQVEGGKRFDLSETEPVLEALYYFLSFGRGIWCGPVLPIAYDSGKRVWSSWSPHRVREWRTRWSWFPELTPALSTSLGQAFSGLLRLLEDSVWNDPVRNAVHWYIEANTNSGGIEGGIVLVQTALELLSWVYLVEDNSTKSFSVNKFDELSAEEKIGELLNKLNIPSVIPLGFTTLTAAAASLNATDGIGFLVRVRNAIVHPKQSNRRKVATAGAEARSEALTIGLWYLELCLLRLIGYKGEYSSRVKGGRLDTVP